MKRLFIFLTILVYSSASWAITDGTFTIDGVGAGVSEYTTVAAFEADIEGTMFGDLIGELTDIEHTIASDVSFDTDTNGYLLKLTAKSGAEHDGTGIGSGARLNYGSRDSLTFDETVDGTLHDIEVSNLILNITGNIDNQGIRLMDGSNDGHWLVNRMLIHGDPDAQHGILIDWRVQGITVSNNIVYDVGDGAGDGGISITGGDVTSGITLYNNTVIRCYDNIIQESAPIDGTWIVKNNLAQHADNTDYRDDGDGFGTTGKNVSSDTSSPDVAYRDYDMISGASDVFVDSGSSDWKLDLGGNAANLGYLDDGEDLSSFFTDDIDGGDARSTWYTGAHEPAAAAATPVIISPKLIITKIIKWLKGFFSISEAHATTYFVKPTGDDGLDGQSEANAWLTVSKANSTLTAGDAVRIMAGTYTGSSNHIDPDNNGTSWSALIVYEDFGDGTVTLSNPSRGYNDGRGNINISGKSYIKVEGITMNASSNADRVVSGNQASYIILENITITGKWNYPIEFNRICDYGNVAACGETKHILLRNITFDDTYSCAEFNFPYDQMYIRGDSHHFLIEDSTFGDSRHFGIYLERRTATIRPSYIIVRNNTITNRQETGFGIGWGNTSGTSPVMFEANYVKAGGAVPVLCPPEQGTGAQIAGGYAIVRYNKIEASGQDFGVGPLAGYFSDGYIANSWPHDPYQNHTYNNTIVNNTGTGMNLREWDAINYGYNQYVNNILVDNHNSAIWEWQFACDSDATLSSPLPCDQVRNNLIGRNSANDVIKFACSVLSLSLEQTVSEANSAYNTCADDRFIFDGNISGDPKFVDQDNFDLTLNVDSDAIDAGVSLAQVASIDTGSGVTLVVDDSRFFQDGWGMTDSPFGVKADYIAVGTVTNTVLISSVSQSYSPEFDFYSGGTIILTQSITRSDGDDVWLVRGSSGITRLYGSAPDIGAEEFSSGVSPVATITITGDPVEGGADGTITISLDSGEPEWITFDLTGGAGFTWGTDAEYPWENKGGVTVTPPSATTPFTSKQDAEVEGTETGTITLTSYADPTTGGVTVAIGEPSAATAFLQDDDSVPGVSVFATDAYASEEGTLTGEFELSCDECTNLSVSFVYSGTADTTEGVDITGVTPSPVIIVNNGTPFKIVVTPIDDDVKGEGTETLILTLDDPAGFDPISGFSAATIYILDNDSAVSNIQVDDFNDGSIASFWRWESGIGGSRTETDGSMKITSGFGRLYDANYEPTIVYQDGVEGNFDVWTKVIHTGWKNNFQRVGLIIKLSGTTYMVMGQVHSSGTTVLESVHTINEASISSAIPEFESTTAYFRVSKSGSSFYSYYAVVNPLSGGTWQLLEPTSGLLFSDEIVDVGFFATTTGGSQFVAQYDYFATWPPTCDMFNVNCPPGKMTSGPLEKGRIRSGPNEVGRIQ